MTALDHRLALDDVEAIESFRSALDRAGYTGPVVDEALMFGGRPFSRDPGLIPVYLRLLPPGEPLTTLIKLFLLDVPVLVEEAAQVFAPLSVERVARLGLVEVEDGRVEALVDIFPAAEIIVASDHYAEHRYPNRPDHVLGLSLSARILACLTVRKPVATALDLGTGSGVHALYAAPHSGRIVGTDINARAIEFARFNAHLNRFSNMELREGSLFEPVEGETFDLIVSNPPYVISPETEYIYRDSGLEGDSFCEGLVRRLPAYLNEGGFAHVLAEWAHEPDEHWAVPLRRWVEGSGCDAILFHYASHDPLSHAADENDLLRSDPGAYSEAIDRWIAYYERLGIERIGWGAVVLRKRSGASNWISEQKVSDVERIAPASHQILRLASAQDFLQHAGDDGGLLSARLRLADEHVLEEALRIGDGGGKVQKAVLRLNGGLHPQVGLDVATVQVLLRLDGRRALGDVLAEIASELDGADERRFAAGALPGIRRLLELGFLVPGEGR